MGEQCDTLCTAETCCDAGPGLSVIATTFPEPTSEVIGWLKTNTVLVIILGVGLLIYVVGICGFVMVVRNRNTQKAAAAVAAGGGAAAKPAASNSSPQTNSEGGQPVRFSF